MVWNEVKLEINLFASTFKNSGLSVVNNLSSKYYIKLS